MRSISFLRTTSAAVIAGTGLALGVEHTCVVRLVALPDRAAVLTIALVTHAIAVCVGLAVVWRLHRLSQRAIAVMTEQVIDATADQYRGRSQPAAEELIPLSRALNVMVERFGLMLKDREFKLETLSVEADRDLLTGVASRAGFMRHLNEELSKRRRGEHRAMGLMFVRASDLAGLNARHGRQRIDEFLKAIGALLRTRIIRWSSEGAFVGRLNGADFALVLPAADPATMDRFAQDLSAAGMRFRDGELTDVVRPFSIGSTLSKRDEELSVLLARCDQALAHCESSNATHVFQDPAAEYGAWAVNRWRDEIRAALKEHRIRLLARPVGMPQSPFHDATYRLKLPSGSYVDADVVSGHAIRCSSIDRIDLRLIELVLQKGLDAPGPMCATVSTHSVRRPSFIPRLKMVLAAYEKARGRLWIEVDDTQGRDGILEARQLARELEAYGISVGIRVAELKLATLFYVGDSAIRFVRLVAPAGGSAEAAPPLDSKVLRMIERALRRRGCRLLVEGAPVPKPAVAEPPIEEEVQGGIWPVLSPSDFPPAPLEMATQPAEVLGDRQTLDALTEPTTAQCESTTTPAAPAPPMSVLLVGILLMVIPLMGRAQSAPVMGGITPVDSISNGNALLNFLPASRSAPEISAPTPALTASTSIESRSIEGTGSVGEAAPAPPPTWNLQDATAFLRVLASGHDRIALLAATGGAVPDAPTSIRINQAVASTLANNRQAQAADAKVAEARLEKMSAYLLYTPNATGSVDGGPEVSAPASINDEYGNRVLYSRHFRRDRSVVVQQPILDLSLVAGIRSARDQESLATLDRRDKDEGLASDTTTAYLGLLQSRFSVELAMQYKAYLDDLSSRMKARVDAGGSARADLDRIRGRAGNAEAARIEALGQYDSDLAEFERLTRTEPTDLVIPDNLGPAIPESPAQALALAVAQNPSYLSALKKIDLAGDDERRALSTLAPKVSLEFSSTYTYNAGGAADGNPIDGVYPTQRDRNVMLTVQWSLGASSVANAYAARAKERANLLESEDAHDRIEQGIFTSYAAVNAASRRAAVLRQTVAANERVVRSFEAQFTEGSRSLFELLDAYEQLYNSRLNFMRAAFVEAKADYQVHRQIGDLIPSLISQEGKSP